VKVGVINPEKVIKNTSRGKASLQVLDKLRSSKQKRINQFQTEIKTLQNELQSPALGAGARESKSLQLQTRQTQLRRYIEDSQREIKIKVNSQMENFRKQIMPLINSVGKAKGFMIIFDLSSSGVAYFDQTIDITDEVVRAYEAKYPAKR
jgi:outer membrane protein